MSPSHKVQRTEDEVREAYARSVSARHMAELLGVAHHTTAHRLAKDSGLPIPAPHWGHARLDIPERLLEMETDDEELVRMLEAKGYVLVRDPFRDDREHDVTFPAYDGQGSFKVGVVSDTHGGSRYQQGSYLHYAYDYFEREGINTVLHAGDVTAGSLHMHPGMAYEMFSLGSDEQAAYVAEHYPRRTGITTLMISGNHDWSHKKAGGSNPLELIAMKRDDITYLGHAGAYVTINGIRIYVMHPSGGIPYAKSWRLQKVIEGFAPGPTKPKVIIMGHLHSTCILPNYRNVYGIMTGCFESQTPYEREKGLYPEVGFAVLHTTYDDDGAVAFKHEWRPCYVPKEHDY